MEEESLTKLRQKMDKPFRILSIDGGGIRGVFPAKILADLEDDLQSRGSSRTRIYEHFDLICGTSTGGIIAIALALGVPARQILNLYLENAGLIFGSKVRCLSRLFYSAHKRKVLEDLVRSTFRVDGLTREPRLEDCKTNLCIPIFDLMQGKPSVLKTRHHKSYIRDFHIPAYQVALATAAAPTYFDPYSGRYTDLNGSEQHFNNKVDGGVVANNPTLIGIIEARKAFGAPLESLRVLSIGTGTQTFCDTRTKSHWGLIYWIMGGRKRIIDLFMQGQALQVENLISLLHRGIDKREPENFVYHRIDTVLDETCNIELDETRKERLEKLVEKAHYEFQNHASILRNRFIDLLA
jgi:patatin-like phospholipase/acyl hydrolase